MSLWKKLFGGGAGAAPQRMTPAASGRGAASDYRSDPFIALCLDVEW